MSLMRPDASQTFLTHLKERPAAPHIIDAHELVRLLTQLGFAGGAAALDAMRALNAGRETLEVMSARRGRPGVEALLARSDAADIFWHVAALGAANNAPLETAYEAYRFLQRALNIFHAEGSSLVHFEPELRGAEGLKLLQTLEERAVSDMSRSADERIAIIAARFPSGAAALAALIPQSQQLAQHAGALMRALLTADTSHRALSVEAKNALMRQLWAAAPPATRTLLLAYLNTDRLALAQAAQRGLAPIFAQDATPDVIACLLPLRYSLTELDWDTLALDLLCSPNPDLRAPALDALEQGQPTRAALPALSAARAQASLLERRRIDRVIAAIQEREPMAGDAHGALSLSEQSDSAGALSLSAPDGGAGALSLPEHAGQAPDAAQLTRSQSRDALLARWSHVAPAPRRRSWPLWAALYVYGSSGRRAAVWLWLAAGALLAQTPSDIGGLLFNGWYYGGMIALVWAFATEKVSAASLRRALVHAPAALARVVETSGAMTTLQIEGDKPVKVKGLRHLEPGALVPVWRVNRGAFIELLPLESSALLRLDPDGVVRARRAALFAAPLLLAAALIGVLLGLGALAA